MNPVTIPAPPRGTAHPSSDARSTRLAGSARTACSRAGRAGVARALLSAALAALLAGAPLPGVASDARTALIIGLSRYADPAVTPLRGVEHDMASARAIARAMDIPDQGTRVIRNAQATKAGLLAALRELGERTRDGSRAFIYFSGHGTRYFDPQAGGCVEGLLTYDGLVITHAELAEATRPVGLRADKLVVMLDACHSEGVLSSKAASTRSLGDVLVPKFSTATATSPAACSVVANYRTRGLFAESTRLGALRENVVMITSARPDEVSFDEPDRGGLATQGIRDCLLGKARDLDASGAVSLEEIRACAQAVVDERLRPFPALAPHTITLSGNRNLVPVAVSRPPSASETRPTSAVANLPASAQRLPATLPAPAPVSVTLAPSSPTEPAASPARPSQAPTPPDPTPPAVPAPAPVLSPAARPPSPALSSPLPPSATLPSTVPPAAVSPSIRPPSAANPSTLPPSPATPALSLPGATSPVAIGPTPPPAVPGVGAAPARPTGVLQSVTPAAPAPQAPIVSIVSIVPVAPLAPAAPVAPAAQVPPPAEPPAPLASLATLVDIASQADPRRAPEVSGHDRRLRIGRDTLDLVITPPRDGYLYLVLLGSDARSFYLLFPNGLDMDNRVRAGQPLRLPREDWRIRAAGPAGINQLLVVVSDTPRTIERLGRSRPDAKAPFTFALNTLGGRGALFDFLTSAPAGGAESFGARLVTVEEVK